MQEFKDREILTYSSLKTFRNCRRMYDIRNNRCLVPLEDESDAQNLGAIFHGCMERWYRRDTNLPVERTIEEVLDYIDASYTNRLQDERQRKNRHLARAMFLAYVEKYPSEDFEVVAVEREFQAPIINPDTDCASRTFIMSGKVDAVIMKDGRYYILEHKTASSIDGGYIERLPMDFQVTLYSDYIERSMNIRIAGILYNVVAKAQIKQGRGETEAEFEERRAALIAKSKTGKTSAKRQMPESDAEFQERLSAKYREDGMFHRELLYISREQYDVLHSEVWELTQQLLLARRTGRWYMNTDYCFHYNRPCVYFPICRSGDNPNTVENLYRVAPPHPELSAASAKEPAEIF